jgi:hypothetical protein
MNLIVGVGVSQTTKAIHKDDTRFVHGRPDQARRANAFHENASLARCHEWARTIDDIGTKVLTQEASTIQGQDLSRSIGIGVLQELS